MTIWTISIVAADPHDAVPLPVRVRRFLKSALRVHGLRCTALSHDEPTTEPSIDAIVRQDDIAGESHARKK